MRFCLPLLLFAASVAAAEPPAGFTPLFNGRDLAGWRGRPHLDPAAEADGTPEERAKRQAEWDADLAAHWRVDDGVIVNDGKGVFLTTDRDYADFELHLEWMFPGPCGDSGVYLRGNPQVQIWDPGCERDVKLGCQKGSGGLWNSPAGAEGKDPLVRADRPIGEWNVFRIRIQGARVTVVLNDRLVVDNQPLPNYFSKGATPLPDRGPIQIQTHGAAMHVRNVFIRELGTLDGSGPGWRDLDEADFVNVNCAADTWAWKNGTVRCSGAPVGVIRTTRPCTNFELSAEWRHLQKAGNSGIFLWAPAHVFDKLPAGTLPPGGIEVQVLDHGYTEQYERTTGKKAWFRTDGDVFPVGSSDMTPFPPVAADGKRSFPTSRHSRGTPEWNQYYVRAIDGEVRLWVNGHEVSGGTDCCPATGFLCLESEGAPVEFRRLRIRELPDARSGFVSLFNGEDLAGWQGEVDGYEAVHGELRAKPGVGGCLLSTEEFGDFVLRFDFKLTPGANNGIAIRTPAQGHPAFDGMEIQVLDDGHRKYGDLQPWQAHGSVYGVVAAERGTCLKPAGQWNSEEVTVKGSRVTVVVNGKTILDADTAPFRDGQPTPDGKPHPGLSRTRGHIGFAGHHDEVHFRNIRVKRLAN